jgi:hypothetical protein
VTRSIGKGDAKTERPLRAVFLLFALVLVAAASNGCSGATSVRGHLVTAREDHIAVLLNDGRVLIAGGRSGYGQPSLASAELYDPKTGVFSATGSMGVARDAPAATRLTDGRVLVAGGSAGSQDLQGQASAEVYDPRTGTFSPTGSMTKPMGGSATLLESGRVLILAEGGSAAELYDPATGKFTAAGAMSTERSFYSATLLLDGRVLVSGGIFEMTATLDVSEVFDPSTGEFSKTGSLSVPRDGYSASRLPDGHVLIAGGEEDSRTTLSTAEIFDPISGTFSPVSPMVEARVGGTATVLSDGRVLIAGGSGQRSGKVGSQRLELASAEVFEPKTATFAATGSMTTVRWSNTATALADGRVLFVGGSNDAGTLAPAETCDARSGTFTPAG